MPNQLRGKKIAILVTDGFEEVEMTRPRLAMDSAGADTHLISNNMQVKGWDHTDWGTQFHIDRPLDEARASDYHGLLLPGGVMNPDKLRRMPKALEFVRGFFSTGKPVAVICHGPWTLIDAGVVHGRTLTSYYTLQTDLKNAGANWVDESVVVDDNLISSRNPDDLPAFNEAILKYFA
jgi:protease I